MLSKLAGALTALLLAGAVAVPLPQEPTVGTEIVRLDAVVTDAGGSPVLNLAPEEFQVLEDGKPQRITNFLRVERRDASASAAAAQDSPPSEPAAEVAAEQVRHIVIVVDDLHLAREAVDPAKDALRRFVGDQAAADDNIALVATSSPSTLQSLTQDRAVLRHAIDRIRSRDTGMPAARGSQMTPAQAELILRGDPDALRLATRMLMDEPGSSLAGSPRATVEAADGATPANLDPGEKAAAREAQREARGVLAGALRFSEMSLVTLDEVLRGLASLPGRKLCLLVSDGFLVGRGTSEEQTRLLRQVTDAATRSGTVIYALDARGLAPTAADAGVAGPVSDPGLRDRVARLTREESRATLQRLTDDTGGRLVSGDDAAGAGLDRMLADNEAYYLIAYEPTNTKRDGRYRKIELRLPRHPDFAVRTRRGYLAPGSRRQGGRAALRAGALLPSAAAGPETLTATDVRAALRAPLPANGIPVRVTADYLDLPPVGPQAIVQARVDVAGLTWRATEGRHRADVEVLGGFYDATGQPAGLPFGKRFELDLMEAEYRQAAREGLHYVHRVALGPGRYELRMVAREAALGRLGGARQPLEVPDLGERKLTLSSLFVSVAAGAGASTGGGGELLHDAQLQQRFKRSDSLSFQLYVYNPVADEKGATDVVLQAQVLSGAKAIAASKPQVVVFRYKDGVPLPQGNSTNLESLEPGRYELRVVVVDRKAGAMASRSLDFSVE